MIFGLLGPDGAGKSTLIKLLATVLTPDNGDGLIFGKSIKHAPGQIIPRIGYMSQNFSMYPELSVAENLNFFATIRGVGRTERRHVRNGSTRVRRQASEIPLRRHEAEADAGSDTDA
jgi:ABC-2 type transport system ATP-binding protein